eukprot:m.61293 g.61293  ORF g.61293 m.61293 type:complete len:157 (-) comp22964_c0_seq1:52-522(-)
MMSDHLTIIQHEESLASGKKSSKDDIYFDTVVGHLQDICIGDEFQQTRDEFVNKHKDTFEDKEENKLEYTPIFNSWTELIEGFLQDSLAAKIPGFKMEAFLKVLPKRQEQIEDELFDMLSTLADFQVFKAEMIMAKTGNSEMDDLANAFVVHHIGK